MTDIGMASSVGRRPAGWRRLTAWVLTRGRRAWRRRELRRYIREMGGPTLADIGASRAQLLFEIDREG